MPDAIIDNMSRQFVGIFVRKITKFTFKKYILLFRVNKNLAGVIGTGGGGGNKWYI